MPLNAKELLKRAETLKGKRANFENEWQNVADIFRPIRADVTVTRTEGDKTQFRRLYESLPIVAAETLASILNGTLTNKSSGWFSLQTLNEELNENKNVSTWLSDVSGIMFNKLYNSKSGFEQALVEGYKDIVVFGTTAMKIEESDSYDFVCRTLNIKNFLIAENGDGNVDYIIIKVKKDARQMMDKWGDGSGQLNQEILKAAESDPFREFDIQLHIFPRKERDKNKIDTQNKPIAGVWINEKHQEIIQEIGFNSFPVPVGRSEKATDEVYGTSRCMIALADARQLNTMSKQIDILTELASRPPLNVNANYNKRINLTAGALNYPDQKALASGRPAIEQIVTVGNVPLNKDLIIRKEERIKEAFFLDKLKVFDNPNATATQVLELRAESYRIMSPFSTGLQPYLDSILDRVFDILIRKSFAINDLLGGGSSYKLLPGAVLPEMPQELLEDPQLKVVFNNPINQAQRTTELNSINVMLQSVAMMAEFKPESLDLINADEVIRKKRMILGIDPELLNSKEEVDAIRKSRAQAAQEQQQAVAAQEVVETAAKAKQAGLDVI